jgi:hypothetical protein
MCVCVSVETLPPTLRPHGSYSHTAHHEVHSCGHPCCDAVGLDYALTCVMFWMGTPNLYTPPLHVGLRRDLECPLALSGTVPTPSNTGTRRHRHSRLSQRSPPIVKGPADQRPRRRPPGGVVPLQSKMCVRPLSQSFRITVWPILFCLDSNLTIGSQGDKAVRGIIVALIRR